MNKIEKAILCDKILRKFEGNIAISWVDIHKESFYMDLNSDYYVVENNINYLIAEGMLRRHPSIELLLLTDRGFAVMTDLVNLGYAAKYREEQEKYEMNKRAMEASERSLSIANDSLRISNKSFGWNKINTIGVIIAVIIALVTLYFTIRPQ